MRICAIIPIILVLLLCSSLSAEDRTWNSRDGKFQVEASLLDFDGKTVKLHKKEDGKVVELSLEKLSLLDQLYVKKIMGSLTGDNPSPSGVSEPSPPSRTTEKSGSSGRMWGDDGEAEARIVPEKGAKAPSPELPEGAYQGKVLRVRLESARDIIVQEAPTSWSIEPDPAFLKELGFQPKPVHFRSQESGFRNSFQYEGLVFCEKAPEKFLTSITIRNEDKVQTKVFLGDLRSGEVRSQTWPAKLDIQDISPDGTRAIFIQEQKVVRRPDKYRSPGEEKTRYHLTFADLTQEDFPCVGVLIPFAEKAGGYSNSQCNIVRADWVDERKILTISASGLAMLFDVPSRRAVWLLEGVASSGWVFSPGKKYVIFSDKDGTHCLFETLSGKVVGKFLVPPTQKGARFAFSPDGTRIAACSETEISCWDACTGEFKDSLWLGNIGGLRSQPYWLDDTYLICGDTLFEMKQFLPIWKYSETNPRDRVFAGRYWHLTGEGSSYTLTGLRVPHRTMPKLPVLSEEQKYLIYPGMPVRLIFDTGIPDDRKVCDHVAQNVKDNGWVVAEKAPTTLTVGFQQQPPKEYVYSLGRMSAPHGLLGNRPGAKVTFIPYLYYYSLEREGEVLWGSEKWTDAPDLTVNELETRSVQQVVTEKSKPTSEWYLQAVIPKRIPYNKAGRSAIGSQ